MDGEMFSQQLDGRALAVDPGMHEFTFTADGVVFATQKIMIVQGQRNRFITALMRTGGGGRQKRMVAEKAAPAAATGKKVAKAEPQPAAEPEEDAKPAPAMASLSDNGPGHDTSKVEDEKKSGSVLPYLIGGVGLASVGTGALLTYWGRKDNRMLSQCTPSCDPAATQHIKKLYLGADIALGAGVAALGAAYWVYVVTHRNQEEKATEEALRVDVLPTTSGGFAAVSGRF
jgi:hypothetical protein